MATIQFTYNKEDNIYCFGFWKAGEFIVRACSKNRQEVIEQFCKELEQLEGQQGMINWDYPIRT